MPLSEHIPRIDDRRFEDLMAEVRARIPRYVPEWLPDPTWNDVNESDPGIIMLELFTWLAEILTYRMNRVPELSFLKFLELIGIELQPAEPALAEITFGVSDKHPSEVLVVPMHTQVTAEGSAGGPPVVFETDRALTALRSRLTALLAYDGTTYRPVTAQNLAAQASFEPFGPYAPDGSALLLGFNEELPEREAIDVAVFVGDTGVRPSPVTCNLPSTATFSSARLLWEYWHGSDWRSLETISDQTRAFTRSEHIVFRAPLKGQMQSTSVGPVSDLLWWVRVRVDHSQYERAPKLLAVRLNTVPARQAETVTSEVLGGSDGRPNLTLQTANRPVLHDSMVLEVDEGDGRKPWKQVGDLLGSKADDTHYALDRTSGEVRFGDGFNGRVPVANVDNPTASIVASYRFGGGKRGNVATRSLRTLPNSIAGIDENEVYNLLAAHSGRDEESLDSAKKRAPGSLKSRCRAVTSDDFELLAQQAANVRRAKALPLTHPQFPGVQVPGVVTVIVVPDSPSCTPMPSEGTLRTVCAYLDQRRLLTTEVYVVPPQYQRVEIRGEVVAADDADLAAVRDQIEQELLKYFHPLEGGEDGQGWPFGEPILYSRVYQRVFTVPGVRSIEQLVILLDDQESLECRNVDIEPAALLYSSQHAVRVRYRLEE